MLMERLNIDLLAKLIKKIPQKIKSLTLYSMLTIVLAGLDRPVSTVELTIVKC